jgi:hypothetical protein
MDPSSLGHSRLGQLSGVLLVIGLLAVIASGFAMGLGHLHAPDRPVFRGIRAYILFCSIGLLVVSVLLGLAARSRTH